MKLQALIAAMIVGFVVVLAACVFIFQDNVTRFLLNPRTPYQTYAPPPAPDYAEAGSWALQGVGAQGADVFFVHPTTYYAARHWNAPLDDPHATQKLERVVLPNFAAPFYDVGRVYAPRYRQATLYADFTHNDDGRAARQTAYSDVREAFSAFLDGREKTTPIILVGYEQGGLHALRLLQEFFEHRPLRSQLVAAYIIGQAAPEDMHAVSLRSIPRCVSAASARCLVTWNAFREDDEREIHRRLNRSLTWNIFGRLTSTQGRTPGCVNPLSWSLDGAYAAPELHRGAVAATGLERGISPPIIEREIGAVCRDGVLIVDSSAKTYLRRRDWFGRQWKVQDFNLFYEDVRTNARERISALNTILEAEALLAPPLDSGLIDVPDSPINKVPG